MAASELLSLGLGDILKEGVSSACNKGTSLSSSDLCILCDGMLSTKKGDLIKSINNMIVHANPNMNDDEICVPSFLLSQTTGTLFSRDCLETITSLDSCEIVYGKHGRMMRSSIGVGRGNALI